MQCQTERHIVAKKFKSREYARESVNVVHAQRNCCDVSDEGIYKPDLARLKLLTCVTRDIFR